ncbi:hypothetical protein HaLaN_13699, partial [Haematococcus lacustris]
EYQQRNKRVNDRLPKGRQRLHWAPKYQLGPGPQQHEPRLRVPTSTAPVGSIGPPLPSGG